MSSTSPTSSTAVVDIPDKYGITRLNRATWSRDPRAIKFLLAKGANINGLGYHGHTLLQSAAISDDLPWARLLLDYGADPDVLDPGNGLSALNYAIQAGHKEIVELLLAHGAKRGRSVPHDQPLPANESET